MTKHPAALTWTETGKGYEWSSNKVRAGWYEIIEYNPDRFVVGVVKDDRNTPFAKASSLQEAKKAAQAHSQRRMEVAND